MKLTLRYRTTSIFFGCWSEAGHERCYCPKLINKSLFRYSPPKTDWKYIITVIKHWGISQSVLEKRESSRKILHLFSPLALVQRRSGQDICCDYILFLCLNFLELVKPLDKLITEDTVPPLCLLITAQLVRLVPGSTCSSQWRLNNGRGWWYSSVQGAKFVEILRGHRCSEKVSFNLE